ncbi:MAG TPA: ATP-binding protein [Bryobacteraceae bacterium]|nr:ATP-binding protein [Bryobacteraceae bacterium]
MPALKRWSDFSLRTKGLIVVAFPATATVVIACAAYWMAAMAERAEFAVNHSREISDMVLKLRVDETETSIAHRGYLLTHEDAFADRMRSADAAFDHRLQDLAVKTADDPKRQAEVKEISDIHRIRSKSIEAAAARLGAGELPLPALIEILRTSENGRLRMNALVTAMLDDESRVLARNLSRVKTLRSRMRAVIGIFVLVGVLGGSIISLLFASGITSRIGKLAENVARLPSGRTLDPGPGGQDEIGVLGQGVASAAEILRQKTAALENALHGIAQADASGRLVSFNKVFGELAGLQEASAPASLQTCVHTDDRLAVERAISQMRSEGRGEAEARIPHPDGTVANVVMICLPVTADHTGGYHIFLRDISQQREAEAALIHAKDEAVAANHAKTDFLAKISHDIRTPLNAILGASDLLAQTSLDPDQREYVTMFQRNSERLVALINDFLDFSRIEAGAVRVERVPLRVRQIADDAVRTFNESAARKGLALAVEIAPEIPDWTAGDPLRIQQVLTNLISNALKFTREGKVTIHLGTTGEEPAPYLCFEVIDTGPGIAPADQAKIFVPFTQLPNQSATSIKGSGLGLTICRELVQLMGGEIGLRSEPGVGSTFWFTVPLERAQPLERPQAGLVERPQAGLVERSQAGLVERPQAGLAGVHPAERPTKSRPGNLPRILIAEDSEDNRILLRAYLRNQPMILEFVENGHEAVDAIRRASYDLILMDIDMPELDGRAATRKIIDWEVSAGRLPTPIVALSAHAIREEVRLCLDAGCIAHVAKPVDQATLLETIERYARTTRPGVSDERSAPTDFAALVADYLASKPRQIEEALTHLARHDLAPIRRFGHNLKGTGRGYGFPEIEELGSKLEQLAQQDDEAGIAGGLLALHRIVTRESPPTVDADSDPQECAVIPFKQRSK